MAMPCCRPLDDGPSSRTASLLSLGSLFFPFLHKDTHPNRTFFVFLNFTWTSLGKSVSRSFLLCLVICSRPMPDVACAPLLGNLNYFIRPIMYGSMTAHHRRPGVGARTFRHYCTYSCHSCYRHFVRCSICPVFSVSLARMMV